MAKLNTNSNSYIIAYATILVVVVAFLLAFVSSALQETQDKNVKNDVKRQILAALRIETDSVDATYARMVKDNLWDGTALKEVPAEDFKTEYDSEIKAKHYHVFVANVDGGEKYVVPVYGMGLWGPIWGYVSFNADKKTIYGTYFSHEGETPGLGAEIATPAFQSQFEGKLLQENGEVKISVVKHGKVSNAECEVDGITGGTITSKGVNNMLHACLGKYAKFFNQSEPEVAPVQVEAVADSAAKAIQDSMAAIQDSLVSVVEQVADSVKAQVAEVK